MLKTPARPIFKVVVLGCAFKPSKRTAICASGAFRTLVTSIRDDKRGAGGRLKVLARTNWDGLFFFEDPGTMPMIKLLHDWEQIMIHAISHPSVQYDIIIENLIQPLEANQNLQESTTSGVLSSFGSHLRWVASSTCNTRGSPRRTRPPVAKRPCPRPRKR